MREEGFLPGVIVQPITPVCPLPVRRPLMFQDWIHLTFLHWRCDPAHAQRLLPPGLTIDTFEGNAWIALVPFGIRNLRPPLLPPLPWLSNFPETNVRTYAIGPDGSRGVWFFSLDAARVLAVAGARAGYALPYFWASMSLDCAGETISYRSARKWPRPATEATTIQIETGLAFRPEELNPLDHFLTARFRLFTVFGKALAFAPIEHAPWPLRRANLLHLEETLIQAAGFAPPQGTPLVHYSERITVRIGAPRRFSGAAL